MQRYCHKTTDVNRSTVEVIGPKPADCRRRETVTDNAEKRVRAPTEKGRLYQKQLYGEKRVKCMKKLERLMRSIDPLLESDEHVGEIRTKLLEIDHVFYEVVDSHGKYHKLIEDASERVDSSKWMNDQDALVFSFKKHVDECLDEFHKTTNIDQHSIDVERNEIDNTSQWSQSHKKHQSVLEQSRILPALPNYPQLAPELQQNENIPQHHTEFRPPPLDKYSHF